MSLSLKAGVRLHGIRPELVVALVVCEGVFREAGYDFIVTSGTDGQHMRGSAHYDGSAVDGRLHHIPEAQRTTLVDQCRDRLGDDYDVLLEGAGTNNVHVHVEVDPKRSYSGPV